MSSNTNLPPAPAEAPEAESHGPQPEIKVGPRRFTLRDFLKTCVQINGSDIHLQAASTPKIRVDGRPRFLDCPAPDDAALTEMVDTLLGSNDEKRKILHD